MPVQSGKCSERNGYNPEEQNICHHQKTSIPTAPEHTLCHYSVDRLKYNNQCNRIHKLPCNLLCFRCNIIKPDYIRTDQQNNPCSCCPHKEGEDLCDTQEKVKRFDRKTIEYFGLEEKEYVYQDLIREIDEKMTSEMLADICRDCEWFPISACRKNICGNK